MIREAIAGLALVGCGRIDFDLLGGGAADAGCTELGTWQRESEWMLGPVAGSSVGNPAPDSIGRPVWSYEQASGGPLGAPDVWYQQPSTLLLWDDAWFGDIGVWSGGDDQPPLVWKNEMIHLVRSDLFALTPIIRWRNPLDTAIELSLAGFLRINFEGDTEGPDIDVDVAVAAQTATGISRDILVRSVSKPTRDTSFEAVTIDIPAGTSGQLEAGGSLLISVRGQTSVATSTWIDFDDRLMLVARACP
jgi:hypothetical protein